jgi:hypothetical protein
MNNKTSYFLLAILAWAAALPFAAERVASGERAPSAVRLQGDSNGLRIAVTPPEFDDVGSILTSMGWDFTEIQFEDLQDYDTLSQFDVIFITCSEAAQNYSNYPEYHSDENIANLERFVREGGTLYVSDYAYWFIDYGFPGYVSYSDGDQYGRFQTVAADVVDPGLASALDSQAVPITFDLDRWISIESVSDDVHVYLSGDYAVMDGDPASDKPITVSFPYGDGRVVYTAFHNRQQATVVEEQLLTYLVLVTTTEELSARLQDALAGSDNVMQQEILGSISAGETSRRYTFTNPSTSNLAIGLNWPAGTLELTVYLPDGSVYAQLPGPPPTVIDITAPEAGDWTVEVTGTEVPYRNMAFTLQFWTSGQAGPAPTPGSGVLSTPEGGSAARPTTMYLGIGAGLCLCGLLAAALIVGAVILVKRRRV